MYRWTALVVLGVVLLLAAAIVMLVPTIPQRSGSAALPPVGSSDTWIVVEDNVTGFSFTGSTPLTVSWNSGTELYLDYAICSSPKSNLSGFFVGIPGCNTVYGPMGPSGSVSLSQPNGGSIILAWSQSASEPQNYSVSYSVTSSVPMATLALLIAGIASTSVGIYWFVTMRGPDVVLPPGPSDGRPPD